jgi:carbamoyltransferase
MNLPSIAFFPGHNASISIYRDNDILTIIELERITNIKNSSFDYFMPLVNQEIVLNELANYIKTEYNIDKYDKFIINNNGRGNDIEKFKLHFPANEYIIDLSHHVAHSFGSLYQSPFNEAIILSFDGGGEDGHFNIYLAKKQEELKLIKQVHIDLGSHYHLLGSVCKDIKNYNVLTAAGKVMGLQSYGEVIKEWKNPLKEFLISSIPFYNNCNYKIKTLSEKINTKLYSVYIQQIGFQHLDDVTPDNLLTGKIAYNLLRTEQEVFEEIVFEQLDEIMSQYNLPLIISGGCAMNILFNTSAKNRYNRDVFVAPNSSDCGLSFGLLMKYMKPTKIMDITYKGIGILDKNILIEESQKRNCNKTNLNQIINDLSNNKILGIIQNNSEHGPRALGNRSIICSPISLDMKDILNFKVKHREWFRPFAPIVRLEDVSKYFEWEGESRWMNFCPKVRLEYIDKIPAVVHVDGTARVQTITREQNEFIYDLLTLFEEKTGIGVLLNTSFNIDGKPILSTYKDAFKVFDETQLDRLYLNGYYFSK